MSNPPEAAGWASGPASPGKSFFSSRWVDRPEHAVEVPEGGLPRGFRAAGVACGLKPGGALDLGIVVSDVPETTSAARFSRTGTPSAPVQVCLDHTRLEAIRAVIVNSGNANAATGRRGYDDAAKMQGGAALIAGVPEDQVAVASTGVIGVPLDSRRIAQGTAALSGALGPGGGSRFAAAIRTTDAFPKQVTLDIALSSGNARLSVQAKGAGMISPKFATLLVFAQTDAAMDAGEASLLLSVCTKRSFDRISVDGQLSTSDTIVLQCSGASGVRIEPHTEDERRFGAALDAALRQLSLLVVRDGEGARRVGRVHVEGSDEVAVNRCAHAIADSPLVKTALYGGDPNWGRIIQAVGGALPVPAQRAAKVEPLAVEISIEGIAVCRGGAFVEHDAEALAAAVQGEEVEYAVKLPGGGFEAERFFSDLGHGYVTINAEYTT